MTEPRLMTGADAAAYLGLTPASFSEWVADGRAPKPLPGTRRWDRKAIDLALDKISEIPPAPVSKEDQEEEEAQKWLRGYEARKAGRDRGSEMTKARRGTQKVARVGRQRTYAEPRVSIEEALEAARVALLDMKKD